MRKTMFIKNKRAIKRKKFLSFALFLFIMTLTISTFSVNPVGNIKEEANIKYIDDQPIIIDTSSKDLEEVSKNYRIESVIKEEEIIYNINYPIFEDKELNEKVHNRIKKSLNIFKFEFKRYIPLNVQKDFIFNLNTNISFLDNKIIFIKFDIEMDYIKYPNSIKYYEIYMYDLENKNEIYAKDIFNEGYLNLFFDEAKSYFYNNYGIIIKKSENYREIQPIEDNYKSCFINNKFLEITMYDYKKGEEILLSVPMDKVYPYINQKYLNTETINNFNHTIITSEASTIITSETSSQVMSKDNNDNNVSKKVRKIDKDKPMIALTFDDGPNSSTTNKVLDVLEKNDARATFFILGRRINREVETLKRIDLLGNQIGNHTFNHKDLTKLSKTEIEKEVNLTNDSLLKAIGKKVNMVRVPYGALNNTVKETIKYPLIMWNIDTKDWKTKNVNYILKEIRDNVKDGDIILMHDLYESTVKATEIIVPELIKKGFQLVTVEELMEYRKVTLKNGKSYFNVKKK